MDGDITWNRITSGCHPQSKASDRMSQQSNGSASSSSSAMSGRSRDAESQRLPTQTKRINDNSYSRHSTWVHPVLAFQSQIPPTYHNQFQALSWRKGKWTEEEEFYAKKLIDAFNGGYLKVSSGTTLRSFLAERLYW